MLYRSYPVPDEAGHTAGRYTLLPLHTPDLIIEALLETVPAILLLDICEQILATLQPQDNPPNLPNPPNPVNPVQSLPRSARCQTCVPPKS